MIDEISAEFLLNEMYPEIDGQWVARHKGTFYRNYNPDAMNIYKDENLVEITRDGFLHLLPPAFLSDDDELKGRDKAAKLAKTKQRMHLLEEAFLPVDTIRFRTNMQLEKTLKPILEDKQKYLLREFFDIDIDKEENEYIRQAATLLLYSNELRGDIDFVKNLMKQLTERDVVMTITDYSKEDSSVCTIPMVTYEITIDDLDTEEYAKEHERLQALADFLFEHFVPFDLKTKFIISGKSDKADILEYNVWL